MILSRIIPTLLIEGPALVKTRDFQSWKYLGDIINTVRIFNDKQVDEIIVLDISATPLHKEPRMDIIQEIAQEAFMPLCYGGGIKTIKQIGEILNRGVEKVSLNSAVHETPSLVKEAVSCFGSQSIVISIDVRPLPNGRYTVFSHKGTKNQSICPIKYAQKVQDLGAGEILLSDISRDGKKNGYNIELIKAMSESIDIPLIACSGAGTLNDLKAALDGGASAVAAGSLFTLIGNLDAPLVTYPSSEDIEKLLT